MNASSQQLNLEYRPSTADLRAAAVRRIVARFWLDIFWCFFVGAVIGSAALGHSQVLRIVVPRSGLLGFQLFLTLTVYVISFVGSTAIAFREASRNAGQPHAIIIEPDGITDVSPGVRRFFAWGSIKKVVPSGGGLLVTSVNVGDWIVPDGAFRDRVDRNVFLNALNGVRAGYGLPVSPGSSAIWPPPPGA
jgi:hypothetical protein